MALPDVLEPVRGRYADELAATAPIHDAAIRAAFATVPREHFLGPPPSPDRRSFHLHEPSQTADV